MHDMDAKNKLFKDRCCEWNVIGCDFWFDV
jgi:hypothetical protein